MKFLTIPLLAALSLVSAAATVKGYRPSSTPSNCLGEIQESCQKTNGFTTSSLSIANTTCNLGLAKMFRPMPVPANDVSVNAEFSAPGLSAGKDKMYSKKTPLTKCLCRDGCYFDTKMCKSKSLRSSLRGVLTSPPTLACVLDVAGKGEDSKALLARWIPKQSGCGNK